MRVKGHVAIVLHAHLPYVRHPEHARPLEERWLHEALWESYLPLVDMLDRLEQGGARIALTISISPTLGAMLGDGLLRARFSDHLTRVSRLAALLSDGRGIDRSALESAGCLGPALAFYQHRLAEARASWERIGGDVVGALVGHRDRGNIELITTTATHAYLPGLLATPASIRAQLRIGRSLFEKLTGSFPLGLWLPECAYDPALTQDLAAAGVRYTVLDAHGIELARPRPRYGIAAPVLSERGVAFFARDPASARDVWSRRHGYPGDPLYREFYRDVGFDLPEDALLGEVGPRDAKVATGLKLHRITGPSQHKEPYDPEAAAARAREHARHFVAQREEALGRAMGPHPILVAPFDAELFGHWWLEGPIFLEEALRALDASARAGGIEAITLGEYLGRFPEAVIAEPAASSWGEGGFGAVWAGARAARLWRHVRRAEENVRAAVLARRGARGLSGRALDQAIREVLLLESSDWAFMLERGEMAAYAEARVQAHAQRAAKLAGIAVASHPTVDDLAWVHAICDKDRFGVELSGEEIRGAFDAWEEAG